MILNMFYGFCMALADSVPGVSGGTIAFILGFYEKLLDNVHNIFSKDMTKRKSAIPFIIKLLLGWAIGMAISVTVLSNLFESKIYFLSSVFLGLTSVSIPFIIISEKEDLKGKFGNLIFTLIGLVLVVSISILRDRISGGSSIDFANLQPLQYAYVFFAGMIAITAMVLPGISGATLLLILGVYAPTITGIKELLHFNLSVLPGIICLGLGILTGLALSIGLIRVALKKYKSKTLYFILGLMIGSLCAIGMGPTTLKTPLPALGLSTFSILGFILGIAILLGLEMTRKKLEDYENK